MADPTDAPDETTAEFDTADLARAWTEPAPPTRHARVSWAARTDIGRVRESNEDKVDVFLPEDPSTLARRGRLWAVADGMGGHEAGQIAAEAGLKTLIRAYFADESPAGPAEALRAALDRANVLLLQAAARMGQRTGMGTTVVAAVVRDDVLTVAHVGDSRAYLLRPGEPARALTTDHSWVEEQVRLGVLTRAQAEASPHRNVITRCLGMDGHPGADVATETLRPGDRVLLATDGVTGLLDEATLAHLAAGPGLSQAALDLIDAANDAGGRDNATVLLLRVDAFDPWDDR